MNQVVSSQLSVVSGLTPGPSPSGEGSRYLRDGHSTPLSERRGGGGEVLLKLLVLICVSITLHSPLSILHSPLSPFTSLRAQSDLYERYSEQEGVMVAFVSGFPLDSSSRIDVTVVEATSEEGWAWMRHEFLIADLMPEQQADLREGSDVVLFARRNRSNPREGAPVVGENIDIAASCYVGISYLRRAVYIFCADSEEQSDAIVTLLVKKIMHGNRR